MNLVPNKRDNNQGLNGWFGELIGSAVSGLIVMAGNLVGGFVTNYSMGFIGPQSSFMQSFYEGVNNFSAKVENKLGQMMRVADITPAEETILKNWLEQKFLPYLEKLFIEVSQANKLTSPQAKIVALNAVINKVAAIEKHFSVTGEPGLSQKALDERNMMIEFLLGPLNELLMVSVSKLGTSTLQQVSFPVGQYNYQPLIASSAIGNVVATNYKLSAGSNPSNNFLPIDNPKSPVANTGTPVKTGTGGSTIPNIPTDKYTNQPVKGGNTPTTTQNPTTVATPIDAENNLPAPGTPEPAKRSQTAVYVGVGLAIVAVLSMLSGKKKTAAKSTK